MLQIVFLGVMLTDRKTCLKKPKSLALCVERGVNRALGDKTKVITTVFCLLNLS